MTVTFLASQEAKQTSKVCKLQEVAASSWWAIFRMTNNTKAKKERVGVGFVAPKFCSVLSKAKSTESWDYFFCFCFSGEVTTSLTPWRCRRGGKKWRLVHVFRQRNHYGNWEQEVQRAIFVMQQRGFPHYHCFRGNEIRLTGQFTKYRLKSVGSFSWRVLIRLVPLIKARWLSGGQQGWHELLQMNGSVDRYERVVVKQRDVTIYTRW